MKRAVRPPVSFSFASVEVLEQRIAPAALIGLDDTNHLLAFDSATPGTVVTTAVTGLAAGETLIGIDFRPANGALYGVATGGSAAGHVYLINPTTGVATLSATLVADSADTTSPFTTVSGTNFGFDFDPALDRLRLVSDTNQNLHINVDNGFVTTDDPLNPTGSAVAGAAYGNSFAGAASTTLYDVDVATDTLYIQTPADNGTLTSGQPLGVAAIGVGGFDILSARDASGHVTETAFAALKVGAATGLYNIDLSTGAASGGAAIGAGSTPLRGLTAVIAAPAGTAYTIDSSNLHLDSFNTATPGAGLIDHGAVTGLGTGESILGFDFRPSTGLLYLVTKDASKTGHLYTVNPATAAVTANPVGNPAGKISGATFTGTNFGVDFNPTTNALQIVGDDGQSLAVNIETGAATVQPALHGATTAAHNSAYANNFAGATATTLYDLNTTTDQLFTQVPGTGVTTLVGPLGVDASAVGGFDIGTDGHAFATLTVAGVAGLYSIDLHTGAATAVGALGGVTGDTLGLALAPHGSFQFHTPTLSVAESAGVATLTIDRVGGSDGTSTVLVNTATGTAGAADFTAVSQAVTFAPGVVSQTVSIPITRDFLAESSETFTVKLSDPIGGAQLDTANTATVTILDDPAHFISAHLARYTDVDGDVVTVKTTVGTLSLSNFTFAPAGTHGGLQLQKLDLSSPTFINTNLSITAARTAAGGDGFVNVGAIDAHGNTLGAVSVNGDLGQIDANAAKALGVLSLGKLGVSTQAAGGSLQSTFVFNLPTLIVRTDIVDASISALNFTAATVFGDVVGGSADHSGSIEAAGRIGALTIGGTLQSGADAASGSVIAKTVGALKIHEIDGGRIFIAGNTVGAAATPANLASALALGSLSVAGNVQNAEILVGFDRTGAPVNADVQIGAISVTGNWVASNLSAGVKAGADGFYGSDTGAVISGGGAVVSRIASITIKGQVYGTVAPTTDRFGFVAEQIGAFTVGTTKLPLSSLTTSKDNLTVGFTDDVVVREY